ncbi:MAG: hypothetical protein K2H39_07725 [Paramuribaculum sp.]|nr:hypothetical protein [Paramuribaculum sp.]
MTKDNLEELLELTFEMEGLITLMIKREDMTPDKVKNLLQRKAEKFNELLGVKVDYIPDAVRESVSDNEEPEVESSSAVVEQIESEETVAEVTSATEEANDEVEENIAESTEFEEKEDAQPIVEDYSEPEPTIEIQDDPEEEQSAAPETAAPEVLNDVLSRKSPVFTLNDKFRFRRNLFNDSDEEFYGTLKIIAEMKSMEEVEDYLYNDLCFEPEDEDVKAFVDIISLQFA